MAVEHFRACARCGMLHPLLLLVPVSPDVLWCEHCASINIWPGLFQEVSRV